MSQTVQPFVTPGDMALCRRFAQDFLTHPTAFPISYTYDGNLYTGMPENTTVTRRFVDANIVETIMVGIVPPGLTLRVECQSYRDYPAVEWTLYITADADTRLLENVLAIDTIFKGTATLVHNNGDFCSADGYMEGRTQLAPGVTFTQAPVGGRACDQAFPYQRLLFDTYGVNIAIGWPGQWSCAYTGCASGIRFTAGQEVVHTILKPGETLRTPRMSCVFFTGDEQRGINM